MNKLTKIVILVFAVSLFGVLGFGILTEAGSGDNTSGWAYSETIGWVSFNSTSDGSPVSYGVNLDLDNCNGDLCDLSGYAWSRGTEDDPGGVGWISFNRSDTGNPPAQPYKGGGSGAIAKVDISTGNVTGWFRVLANGGGWDGWYRFCDGSMSYCDNADQIAKIDYDDGDWHGWAWTDMVGGWLSFNNTDSGAGGTAYKVIIAGGLNRPPSASDLEVIKGDYCTTPVHYFSWTYSDPDGHDESQFQFQVDDDTDFDDDGDIKIDRTQTGTWSSGSSNNQTVIVAVSPSSDQIGYNTTYYWRVKVWDSPGKDSGWITGSSFVTETHRYPTIDFNWSPLEPSQDEDVLFSDKSTVYGGSTKSAWAWTFEFGNPATSALQDQIIQFTGINPTGNEVTLTVTDSDGFYCMDSKTVDVQLPLPGWQEILPR